MTYNHKYSIFLTDSFKNEFERIMKYLKYELKEITIAKNFYRDIIKKIYSLELMPERNKILEEHYDKTTRVLRKTFVKNYIIIYEINQKSHQIFILHIFHMNQNYFDLI